MKTSDFSYELPKEMIAQHGLKDRKNARLMVVGNKIEHKKFYEIVEYLNEGDYNQFGLLTIRSKGPWYSRITPFLGFHRDK